MRSSHEKEADGMKLRSIGILMVVLLGTFSFVGCQKAAAPALKEIGPSQTKAGVTFNAQADGSAAMWYKTENATKETVIMWGDKQVRTDFHNPGVLTSPVPPELYAKPGKYEIYLKDPKTGAKSRSLFFTVTE